MEYRDNEIETCSIPLCNETHSDVISNSNDGDRIHELQCGTFLEIYDGLIVESSDREVVSHGFSRQKQDNGLDADERQLDKYPEDAFPPANTVKRNSHEYAARLNKSDCGTLLKQSLSFESKQPGGLDESDGSDSGSGCGFLPNKHLKCGLIDGQASTTTCLNTNMGLISTKNLNVLTQWVTQQKALDKFLLSPETLKNAIENNKIVVRLKKNPKGDKFSSMKLYREDELLALACEIWGSEDKIREERDRRLESGWKRKMENSKKTGIKDIHGSGGKLMEHGLEASLKRQRVMRTRNDGSRRVSLRNAEARLKSVDRRGKSDDIWEEI